MNQKIRVSGRALRIGRLDAELYHFLSNPGPVIERLRSSGNRVDGFRHCDADNFHFRDEHDQHL